MRFCRFVRWYTVDYDGGIFRLLFESYLDKNAVFDVRFPKKYWKEKI